MHLKHIMTCALATALIFGTISPMQGVAAKTVTQNDDGNIYLTGVETMKPTNLPIANSPAASMYVPTIAPQITNIVQITENVAPTPNVNETEETFVPTLTPMPPTSEPIYDTFFWCESETFFYVNTDTTASVQKGVCGFNDLFFGDVKLEEGKDYLDLGANLVITKEFLDTLPEGDTELTVDANYYTGRPHGKTPLVVHKLDIELPNDYTPKYPLSETKQFNSYLKFAVNNNSCIYYQLKSVIDIDKIFVDGDEITDYDITSGEPFLEIPYSVIHPLSIGLHKIEVVSGGTSEILDLIIYDSKMGKMDQLNAVMGQSSYKLDANTSVKISKNYVGLNCTINNISKEIELDKLFVRYI